MRTAPSSYSTVEVAKRLGLSPQTVQRWVDSGRLKAWKTPGGHRRIDAHSADQLFEEMARSLSPAPATQDLQTGLPPGAALRVVIVDDDPLDRELLSALVHAALPSAQLHAAGNGFQGLVMIAKLSPDIVVTDVHMPHMDGFEMIRNVLADAETRPRLMIALSAKSPAELAEFGRLPADVLLLQKPLERAVFTAALTRT